MPDDLSILDRPGVPADHLTRRRRNGRVIVFAGGGLAHTSGGVGTLMRYLLAAWAKRPDAPDVEVIDTRGQSGKAGGIWQFLVLFARLLWVSATGRVDVVHAHMTTRGSVVRKWLLCTTANRFGVPTIIHMHGADFLEFYGRQRPLFQKAIRRVLARASAIIVLGAAWRDFLVTQLGLDPARIEVILNGVPCPETPRRVAGASTGQPVRILFLGRLGDRKGVPELIEALASPLLASRSWQATIAGDGDIARFRALVTDAALEGRIDLPGWIDGVRKEALLAEADILVLPSHHEAMPIAVLEALAYGIPVVTTPVGAVPEFLRDNESAVLVPPGDAGALAAGLARLIDDPAERVRLGEAGHEIFRAKLDIDAVATAILRLYTTAIDRKAAGQADLPPASGSGVSRLHSVLKRIRIIGTTRDETALLDQLSGVERPTIVSFVNQHALNLTWSRPGFSELLEASDHLLRDGVGAELGMTALGRAAGQNMVGTSFLPQLVDRYRGRRVALYGTAEPWCSRAAETLRELGCQVVSVRDGFRPEADYAAAAIDEPAELIVLAMGMPKQERVSVAIARAVTHAVVIANGGAIADYWAGRFVRAPLWIRQARLEWAFRLALEPTRLWNRYVTGGILFLWRIARLKLALHHLEARPVAHPTRSA